MMADKPFRVLLDVTDLHIENFKYVWINVSPRELKTISDFKKSVLHKISLERQDIKLFVRDGLLLENETTMVLREDDTVKVQYESQLPHVHNHVQASRKETEEFPRKRNHSESSISNEPASSKRHRPSIDTFVVNPNEVNTEGTSKKQKKHKKSHLSPGFDKDHSANLEESSHSSEKKKKKKEKSSIIVNSAETDVNFKKNVESFLSFDTGVPSSHQDKNSILKSDNFISLTNNSLTTENESHQPNEEINKSDLSTVNIEDVKISKGISNNCPKKKRKRYKKRKQISESTLLDVPNKDVVDSKVVSFSDNIKRKHIVYVTPDETQDICVDETSNFQNLSTDTSVVNRDKSSIHIESSYDYPKISTPTQSDGCGNPNWQVTLMPARNATIHNKPSNCKSKTFVHDKVISNKNASQISHESEHTPKKKYTNLLAVNSFLNECVSIETHTAHKNGSLSNGKRPDVLDKPITMKNASFQSSEEIKKSSSEKYYVDLPSINSLPEVGTHMAYKTLELDGNYSPVITNYRKGIVKGINSVTEEIEIEFYEELIKPGRTGKFENLLEDEIPDPEIKTCDVLRWSSIISPKYIS